MAETHVKESQDLQGQSPERERVSLAENFGGSSVLRDILETILLALILLLVLNTLTGRFQVRGFSMEPTLHEGQYLIISKVAYWIHPPERGDVIVFRPPNRPDEDYIKRIVGLPGEVIQIRDGSVWVDGSELEEPYITAPPRYTSTFQLAQGEYFVLGDNRNDSSDSHTWGVLPEENIVGKAWLCYWPPEEWGTILHYDFTETGSEQALAN